MNCYDITNLENEIRNIVRTAGVSTRVYANRPKSKDVSDDFVVVSVSSDVEDMAAYGLCYLQVDLFARDSANMKNGARLSAMQAALMQAMPASSGKYLIDENPSILPDVGDDYGFHARIIEFQITLKTV